jgi:hypothetical protein
LDAFISGTSQNQDALYCHRSFSRFKRTCVTWDTRFGILQVYR